MKKQNLGRTGIECSVVGFPGIVAKKLTQEENSKLVRELIKKGINYFDFAPTYGDCQEKLGMVLPEYRKEVYLACKTQARDAKKAKAELERSLDILNTDYFDIYQFHAVNTKNDVDRILGPNGAMETFLKAKKEGLIRNIGITGHRADILTYAINKFPFDTVMTHFDFVDFFSTGSEKGLLQLANRKNMGIQAIKSTYRGKVKDKINAYRYTMSLPVSVTIPAGNKDDIFKAIEAADPFVPMTIPEIQQFLYENNEHEDNFCRQCGYCTGCMNGNQFAYIHQLYVYAKRFDKKYSLRKYDEMNFDINQFEKIDECSMFCPYGVDIKQKLIEIINYFSELNKTLNKK